MVMVVVTMTVLMITVIAMAACRISTQPASIGGLMPPNSVQPDPTQLLGYLSG